MDSLDMAILSCLCENARMTASAIGKRVRLSVSAVTERIRKLEESGVIERYTVLLDDEAIGKGAEAYMEVTLASLDHSDGFCSAVESLDEVMRCDLMAIEYDYLLLVCCSDVGRLDALRKRICAIEGVKGVKVRLVLANKKRRISSVPSV